MNARAGIYPEGQMLMVDMYFIHSAADLKVWSVDVCRVIMLCMLDCKFDSKHGSCHIPIRHIRWLLSSKLVLVIARMGYRLVCEDK